MVFRGNAERASEALIVVVVVRTCDEEAKHCDEKYHERKDKLFSVQQSLQMSRTTLCFLSFAIKKMKA